MKLHDLCCNDDLPLRIACQGVECSYSSIACHCAFDNPEIQFYPSFEEVFSAVQEGQCPYGVLPIENSLAGCVTDNYDLLLEYDLIIAASIAIPVQHCLLALPGADFQELSTVFSHPQALHQSRGFFKAHPQLMLREFSNTAASAQYVAAQGNPQYAAIASEACAQQYGLCVLQRGVQDRKNNFTRFLVLAREPLEHPHADRISLILRLSHSPGSLYRTLAHFARYEINLLKLESRPIPDSPFEVLFYCDFSGNIGDPQILRVMEQLPEDVIFMKFLGNYPQL